MNVNTPIRPVPTPFLAHPTVCAAGDNYIIITPVKYKALLGVRVGEREYWSSSNGVKVSDTKFHRVPVPARELDSAGAYTVLYRRMIKRLSYYPPTGRQQEFEYAFTPVPADRPPRIYHVADTHGLNKEPIELAKTHGNIDLLVLNGDIADASDTEAMLLNHYIITSGITGGQIPCVISRGNHDLRGRLAEKLERYMPVSDGKFYYTFRAGAVWGMVLSTGEDKPDGNAEYGGTICCHDYRIEETAFIKDVIKRAESEYGAPGVSYRLIISHVPFSATDKPPFDIEQELFGEWCSLLKEHVRPDLMLCGHYHRNAVIMPGDEYDDKGQPCPVIWASELNKKEGRFSSAMIELDGDKAHITFDFTYKEPETHTIPLGL